MFLRKPVPVILFFLLTLQLNGWAEAGTSYFKNDQRLADTIPVSDSDELKIFSKVEIEASFPGGDPAWRKWLEQNLNASAPLKYNVPAGSYTVVVQFVVDREGKISDIKALTNHGFGMEQEVVRVIRKGPKWTPAYQGGRSVKAYRKQPVTFWIEEEKETKKNKRN